MKLVVARENQPGETRVAIVPALVGRLAALGWEVLVEPGAGDRAGFTDAAYEEAGALVDPAAVSQADLVVGVRPLDLDGIRALRRGAAQISFLDPSADRGVVEALAASGITAFSMEQVPRISRAQSMDALTSQALVAGYRGAVVAAGLLRRFFPLSMTAAGTVQPAQVLVLGAGVAGLQAIATVRRLGAVVRAYDVRASSAEEISSLGATFLDLGLEPLDGAAGYARTMTPERAEQQRERLAPYVAEADALITTAAVPGRQAPILVSTEMVAAMRPGSVVVDLVADVGGNVEGSVPGKLVSVAGVQLWGGENVPAQMPGPASELYAQNVLSLVGLMTRHGQLAPDLDDEIVAGALVTHGGAVIAR
ncbi:NAD(P) transhydrogenase subunit alpha [Nocardioides marmorisolisilvae]|uniref:proton-translocating NAD(P)(+) transhydrogenase n=2 Tax=Nocardioides marmorisolisilvae TaxID=1542737 RepID=A0A3N0DQ79_9ACTN|nr:NAD(P) transhydrogenase subunit alpha [Nocardioides marmorisolisilvae]